MIFKIKGKTVVLYETTQVGEDEFGQPIYEETPTEIQNVLIEPADGDAIVSELQVNGVHLEYILHIPKGDNHDWRNKIVEFYDAKWKAYGDIKIYDEDLTPLAWNKKVMVERYE